MTSTSPATSSPSSPRASPDRHASGPSVALHSPAARRARRCPPPCRWTASWPVLRASARAHDAGRARAARRCHGRCRERGSLQRRPVPHLPSRRAAATAPSASASRSARRQCSPDLAAGSAPSACTSKSVEAPPSIIARLLVRVLAFVAPARLGAGRAGGGRVLHPSRRRDAQLPRPGIADEAAGGPRRDRRLVCTDRRRSPDRGRRAPVPARRDPARRGTHPRRARPPADGSSCSSSSTPARSPRAAGRSPAPPVRWPNRRAASPRPRSGPGHAGDTAGPCACAPNAPGVPTPLRHAQDVEERLKPLDRARSGCARRSPSVSSSRGPRVE